MEPVKIKLKRKYTTKPQTKNQKSKHNNSGHSKNKKSGKKVEPPIGQPCMLINLSGVDEFCHSTGTKLPKRGIVFRHNGNYYISRAAING
jgi:hypothetical protein